MNWDQPAILEQIADEYGPVMAQNMPVIGPIMLRLFDSFDGAFRMRHLRNLMGANGFPVQSDNQRQRIALAVIKYINASEEPLYFQRKHVAGTFAWVQLTIHPSNKQPLRDLDTQHAMRSRNMVMRHAREFMPAYKPITAPVVPMPEQTAQITASHIEQMRAGIAHHMQSCGMPLASIKSPIALMQIYNNACRAGTIDGAEFIEFTPDQLIDALQVVIDIFTDDERGASNTSLANPDGSLDL